MTNTEEPPALQEASSSTLSTRRLTLISIGLLVAAGVAMSADQRVADAISGLAGSHYVLKRSLSAVNEIFGWWLFIAIGVAVLLDRDRIRRFASLGVAAAACCGAVQLVKIIAGRARPDADIAAGSFTLFAGLGEKMDSFPSGHTAVAWFAALLLEEYFPGSIWFFGPAAAIASISRVAFSRHYLSDVIVGFLFVFVITRLLFRIRSLNFRPLYTSGRDTAHEASPAEVPQVN